MKPIKTKAQIRAELEREIASFVGEGGQVDQVPKGLSGLHDNVNIFAQGFNGQTRAKRTPVTDVVNALDERKKPLPLNKPQVDYRWLWWTFALGVGRWLKRAAMALHCGGFH